MTSANERDGSVFLSCHADWTYDVAALLRTPGAEPSFGLFGRWGAGKSSACVAIRRALGDLNKQNMDRSLKDGGKIDEFLRTEYVSHVTLDASLIRNPESAYRELHRVLSEIAAEYPFSGRRDKEAKKRIFRRTMALSRVLLPIVLSALAGPLGHGAALLSAAMVSSFHEPARALVEKASEKFFDELAKDFAKRLEQEDVPAATDDVSAAGALGRAVVFVDDLDRCDPPEAFRVLAAVAQFHERLSAEATPPVRDAGASAPPFIRFAYAIDPEVLAQHFSKIFGVSESVGMEAMLKYIRAPLTLPPGANKNHESTLRGTPKGLSRDESQALRRRAFETIRTGTVLPPTMESPLAAGSKLAMNYVPARIVLTARTQAALWASRLPDRYRAPNGETACAKAIDALLLLAIVTVTLPEVFRAVLREETAFASIKRLFVSVLGENVASLRRHFGSPTVEALRGRPDLADLGRALLRRWDEIEVQLGRDVLAVAARYGLDA